MLVFFEHVRNNEMKKCQKNIKRSSKNAKRVFGRLKTRIRLFEDLFVIYILSNNLKRMLSISPEYFGDMEKMESFLVFKTFFLISKMDKNKCPIFILKKKFQKMKIVFF